MRHLGTLMAVLALVAARPAAAQDDGGYVERGPRFLLASAKEPVRVDTRKTPVLRQRISLDLQGVSLGEALRDVSQKSGVRLAFSDAVLPPDRTVEFSADNITVAAALTELLIDADVDVLFSKDGGGVLVRKQLSLALIRGTVRDSATGEPLEGASISVVGTQIKAETNSNGQYALRGGAAGHGRDSGTADRVPPGGADRGGGHRRTEGGLHPRGRGHPAGGGRVRGLRDAGAGGP